MSFEILRISTDDKFAGSLRYIRSRLACYEESSSLSSNIYKNADRHELIVVINGEKTANARTILSIRKVANTVIDALANIIVYDCKAHYITSKIKLPIESDINRHAFVKALSEFDSQADKVLARSLLKLTPNFLLDSFYEFMIGSLKSRWDEVCLLANENVCYLVCNKTFSELLRFLISNIKCRSDEVHLFPQSDEIEVLSGGLKPFNNIYINHDLPKNVQVVSKLISIAPKRIFLHEDSNTTIDPTLVSSIKTLFGPCVHVVEN